MFGKRNDGSIAANRHDGYAGRGRALILSAPVLGLFMVLSAPAFANPQSSTASGETSNTPAPNLASRSCTQADAARREGNSQSAIALYTQCLETANLTPEQRAIILTNRGNIHFSLGEQETATVDFERAIELNPDSQVAYYNRGLAAFVIGHYEDAIVDSSEAIRIDPTMAEAFYNRGAAHANLGNYPQAIADLTEAIRLRPDWALAHQSRGDAYLRSGDAENGARDLAEAKRLDPSLGVPLAR
jgi:tetratricopeptide (TPR) repeat protein